MKLFSLLLAVFLVGCDSGQSGGGDGMGDAATGDHEQGGAVDFAGVDQSGVDYAIPEDPITELTITPGNVTLTVAAGATSPTQQFTVQAKTQSGATITPDGAWTIDRYDVGAMNSSTGLFQPTGFVGGDVTVKFQVGALSKTTSLMVRLTTSAGMPPSSTIEQAFAAANQADPTVSVIYPYNQTVFPRGVSAPPLQWTGGQSGNTYRVKITGNTFSFEGNTQADPPSSYTLPVAPVAVWQKLTESSSGPVTVTIQRYDQGAGKAYLPVTQTWVIAPASLKGTIYYNQFSGSDTNIKRIQPGGVAESFLQKPNDVGCIACHSVSANGTRMVAAINGGASPWGVYDVKTGTRLFQSSQASGFEAISPDGEYVLWRHWNEDNAKSDGRFNLSHYNTDAILTQFVPPAVSGYPGHQTWSNDGKKIAFSMRIENNGLDFTNSTLWITDVDVDLPGFSNTKKIVDANAMTVTTYPSFSPDSKWIAFMRANQSRTVSNTSKGQLWITNVDGTVTMPLDRAQGKPDVVDALDANWGPSFHPKQIGGYFWVAFSSKRNYGHTNFQGQRQLWLAAINPNPQAGQDPSYPAFYLTGQGSAFNERPQFTLNPCLSNGAGCESASECCEGFCQMASSGSGFTCQPPPPVCKQKNEGCSAEDCCGGLRCMSGKCDEPPIM